VHRDFKGQNVLVSGSGEDEHARILDFGLAFMRAEPGSSRLTTEGVVMGTPAYMSPEQATGSLLDHRTDLFSLGVLIYEMLAGKLPFDGTPVELARQNLAADAPPIARRVPGLVVHPGLERIAHRLMQKLPRDRFESAHEVIAALDMFEGDAQDTHSVPALSAPLAPARRRARTGAGATSAASAAARRRASTGGVSGGGKDAAPVDASAATESLDQDEVSAPVEAPPLPPAVTTAALPVAPTAGPVAPAVEQAAPARAEQARARGPAHVITERVREGEPRRPPRAVVIVAGLALLAAAVVALLVWRSARDTELATTTPADPPSALAELAAPAPAEVAPAPPPAEVAAPVPAEIGAPAPDSVPADEPAAPGPRSPESRRSRRDRHTTEPAGGAATGPSAGTKPDGKESGPAAGAASDLEALYKRVGHRLAAFERERGAGAARPLWDVYSDIPLLDAMRTPSLGQDAMRTLHRLERQIDTAEEAAQPRP
ncbi:MAG TPA: protein kinase, partial [Haliangium sp.]|nr:protein kinase [Haliangium sp.]